MPVKDVKFSTKDGKVTGHYKNHIIYLGRSFKYAGYSYTINLNGKKVSSGTGDIKTVIREIHRILVGNKIKKQESMTPKQEETVNKYKEFVSNNKGKNCFIYTHNRGSGNYNFVLGYINPKDNKVMMDNYKNQLLDKRSVNALCKKGIFVNVTNTGRIISDKESNAMFLDNKYKDIKDIKEYRLGLKLYENGSII